MAFDEFVSPFFQKKGHFRLGETFRSSGSARISIDGKIQYTTFRSGVFLYVHLKDALKFQNALVEEIPEISWVILKCEINEVIVDGESGYGHTIIVEEITPKEIVDVENKS